MSVLLSMHFNSGTISDTHSLLLCLQACNFLFSYSTLLFLQALDLLSSGPPANAAVSTTRKQQRSIRDFFTSPPFLPSAKRLKTQPQAQHASAASHSAQHARADQNTSCSAQVAAGAVSAAQDSAFSASAAQDSALSAAAAHDSAASASAAQRLLGHKSDTECFGEQIPTEQISARQHLVEQTGTSQASWISKRPALVDAQPATVLQTDPMSQAQGCHTELQCQQRQEGPVVPLGEQSQHLHDSRGGLAAQQGQLTCVALAGASRQQTKGMFVPPAGSDGDKENVCMCVAATQVTT